MTKLVDLTRPLKMLDKEKFPQVLSPLYRIISPEIEFVGHAQGAKIMGQFFGCTEKDLPEGEGWAEDNLSISSHLGTHVDAPWHYGSKCGGAPAKTIEQIPLEDLYCDAVVLNMTAKKLTGQAITIEDLQRALDVVSYEIKDGDAVLIRTDHDKFDLLDPARYAYPGMTRESTLWLIEQGAKIGGTDGFGWDRPFTVMLQDFQATKDKYKIWDAHYAARESEFYIVQQLANLDKLPPHGFKVAFFPIPFVGASAAQTRAVAFV
jgi:kynurenine formamidase